MQESLFLYGCLCNSVTACVFAYFYTIGFASKVDGVTTICHERCIFSILMRRTLNKQCYKYHGGPHFYDPLFSVWMHSGVDAN